MAQLIITMDFDDASDAEFMKSKVEGAVEDLCIEYARNLDTEDVMITLEVVDA